jgi:hypothetical protein
MGASLGDTSLIDGNINAVSEPLTEDSQYFSREEMIRLPTLYVRAHKFSWYFCDFIQFSNQCQSSRSKLRLDSAAQPCHLVCASCPPHTASCQVRVCTASNCRHDHSMKHTRSCNVSGLLSMILQHCLSIESSPTLHMSI